MDRDPQTAEALYKLVSQWPSEARQIGLDFNNYENGYRPHWTLDHGTREFCPLNYAIDLHLASGLRWLIQHVWIVSSQPIGMAHGEMDTRTGGYRIDFGMVETDHDAPTLFLALHAAIIAAKENA